MTPLTTETKCFHGRLAFADDGVRVVCLDCSTGWPPRAGESAPEPIGLGRGDERVSARHMGGSRGNLDADQTRVPHPIGFFEDPDPGSKR